MARINKRAFGGAVSFRHSSTGQDCKFIVNAHTTRSGLYSVSYKYIAVNGETWTHSRYFKSLDGLACNIANEAISKRVPVADRDRLRRLVVEHFLACRKN